VHRGGPADKNKELRPVGKKGDAITVRRGEGVLREWCHSRSCVGGNLVGIAKEAERRQREEWVM